MSTNKRTMKSEKNYLSKSSLWVISGLKRSGSSFTPQTECWFQMGFFLWFGSSQFELEMTVYVPRAKGSPEDQGLAKKESCNITATVVLTYMCMKIRAPLFTITLLLCEDADMAACRNM